MVENQIKKLDRRVIRTKRAIRTSFLKLLAEKEFDKITVKDIADGAEIDRKTLYNYYKGVNEVLEELENELAENFEKAIGEFEFEGIEDTMAAFTALNVFLQEHIELYTLIMKIDGKSVLISRIVVYLKEKIRSVIKRLEIEDFKIDVAVEYVTAGMFTAYRHWFNSDRKQSLEDFTEEISALVLGGLPAYLVEK